MAGSKDKGEAGKGSRPALFEALRLYLPAALAVLVAFWVAFQFVGPAPPDRVTIFSGSPDGAYYGIAGRYAEVLAGHGIVAEVVATNGSSDNLARLAGLDEGADATFAFVQAGITPPAAPDGGRIEALASLYYEPLWFFVREDVIVDDMRDLGALTVAVGPSGSGSRALAQAIYRLNGLLLPDDDSSRLGGAAATAALILGQVDAVLLVGGAGSRTVQELLASEGVRLLGFRRADAYARRLGYIESVRLPEGVIDMAANIPAREVPLIATTAMLAARNDLHPALVELLLIIATDIHGEAGLFEAVEEFPSAHKVSLPLAEDARRFLRRGPSFLQRVLPFWAASMIDRWIVMLLPLLTLLLPLARLLPPLYAWRIRSRITRPYKAIRAIENNPGPPGEAARRLGELEAEVARITVPPGYAGELYGLKFHLQMLKDRLAAAEPPVARKPRRPRPARDPAPSGAPDSA